MNDLADDLEVLKAALARSARQGHRFAEAYLKQYQMILTAERSSMEPSISVRRERAASVVSDRANPFMYPLK
jgi:hypothetical protein